MNARQIVDGLTSMSFHTANEARTDSPEVAGFYAWWCDIGRLPSGVPQLNHPETADSLLYVGIAPESAQSNSNLRKRLRQHTSGAIGSSTLRRGLTALLWEVEGWQPIWASTRPGLEHQDLESLNAWQRENLRVQWVVVDDPWKLEREVIAEMRPPMNLAHNQTHEFHLAMSTARATFKQAAERHREIDM